MVVRFNRRGKECFKLRYNYLKCLLELDLLYYELLLNYCDVDLSEGFFGILGCVCNILFFGIDGCELLCCGCGYNI